MARTGTEHQPEPFSQGAPIVQLAFTVRVFTVLQCTLKLPTPCTVMCVCSLETRVTCSLVFQPLGASDYLEMARLFDTVFIRHVPMLTLTLKDQARRFTTLIDNFYDHKVLCLSA